MKYILPLLLAYSITAHKYMHSMDWHSDEARLLEEWQCLQETASSNESDSDDSDSDDTGDYCYEARMQAQNIKNLIATFNNLKAQGNQKECHKIVDALSDVYFASHPLVKKNHASDVLNVCETLFIECHEAIICLRDNNAELALSLAHQAARALEQIHALDPDISHALCQRYLSSAFRRSCAGVETPVILSAICKVSKPSERAQVIDSILQKLGKSLAVVILNNQPVRTDCDNGPLSLNAIVAYMCNNPTIQSTDFLIENADQLPADHIPSIINVVRTQCTSLEGIATYLMCMHSTVPALVSAYEHISAPLLFSLPAPHPHTGNAGRWHFVAPLLVNYNSRQYYPQYHTKLLDLINSHADFKEQLETCASLWKFDKNNGYSSCTIAHWIAQQCTIPLESPSVEDIAVCSANQARDKADSTFCTIFQSIYNTFDATDAQHTQKDILVGMHLASKTFCTHSNIWHQKLAYNIKKSPLADDTTKQTVQQLIKQLK